MLLWRVAQWLAKQLRAGVAEAKQGTASAAALKAGRGAEAGHAA